MYTFNFSFIDWSGEVDWRSVLIWLKLNTSTVVAHFNILYMLYWLYSRSSRIDSMNSKAHQLPMATRQLQFTKEIYIRGHLPLTAKFKWSHFTFFLDLHATARFRTNKRASLRNSSEEATTCCEQLFRTKDWQLMVANCFTVESVR